MSEGWVVRYKNRLLQLEWQTQRWAPSKSRVRVRENEDSEGAIYYRGQRLRFRDRQTASTTLGAATDVAPSPHPPLPRRSIIQLRIIRGDKAGGK